MRTPNWKPETIAFKRIGGLSARVVLEFESEDIDPKRHFTKECGWSEDEYKDIANNYWFTAVVVIYLGQQKVEDACVFLGGCCYSSKREVMADGVLENILAGYAPQMVEESLKLATSSLTLHGDGKAFKHMTATEIVSTIREADTDDEVAAIVEGIRTCGIEVI